MQNLVTRKFWGIVFVCLMTSIPGMSHAQTYDPLAYWMFEYPDSVRDTAGTGYVFTVPAVPIIDSTHGIVGSYVQFPDTNFQPHLNSAVDSADNDAAMSIEFWLRFDKQFFRGTACNWNRFEIRYSETEVRIFVRRQNATHIHTINLDGTGLTDPHRFLDGQWHHHAVTFDAKTGDLKYYVDGQSPEAFQASFGPGMPLRVGGFNLSANSFIEKIEGCIDEVALYERVIPHSLVMQHFLEGLGGNHYSFQDTFSGSLPDAIPTVENGLNPLEFPPGYPNVADTPSIMLARYPGPRYHPGHDLMPLIPWYVDLDIEDKYGIGSTDTIRMRQVRGIMETLAQDHNYYLYMGILPNWFLANHVTRPDFFEYNMIQSANSSQNTGLPRFAITSWKQARVVQFYFPVAHPYGFSATSHQGHPNNWYIRNMSNAPVLFGTQKRINYAIAADTNDVRWDSLDLDRQTNAFYVDTMFSHLSTPYLDLIGENGEIFAELTQQIIDQDPEMGPDFMNAGLLREHYLATRVRTFRQRYRDFQTDTIDTFNSGAGRAPVEYWWYDAGGNFSFSYDTMRTVSRYNDGRHRGAPYYYPNSPSRWRYGDGLFRGLNELILARREEIAAGDSFFVPAVSPGFNGNGYAVDDEFMIRPGQFLGLLKAMAMMGAESYNLFEYHTTTNPTAGNWKIWKPAILSYAQAMTSRIGDLFFGGHVLDGDLGYLSGANGLIEPSYYTFSTGNQMDLVAARAHNSA